MKKIGYLGMGTWGFCLASLLAAKEKYEIVCWTTKPELAHLLNIEKQHPAFPNYILKGNIRFTTDLKDALKNADLIIESVTSQGIRPVFEQLKALGLHLCPIILTSKGIEYDTHLILPEVVVEVLGEEFHAFIGLLSGPSFAEEVIKGCPTSVVSAGYNREIIDLICETFTTKNFRVYPNLDMRGVALGGALKNIIAIACGICNGLSLGSSATAALITRGLHEIKKLGLAFGAQSHTLNGLAGMGDLCLTCSSLMSRNFRFGTLLAQGFSPSEAKRKIAMVIEGVHACDTALQLSKHYHIEMPITQAVSEIIQEKIKPSDAVSILMQRAIKEEHL